MNLFPNQRLDVFQRIGGGASYVAEYQAVYDEFGTPPSSGDADAQNTFVQAGVTDGWWSDLDRLFILASHASGADSLLDWIHPTVGANVATLVNAPAWTQYQGYISTGTEYINTNYDPTNDGVNFTLNDGSFGNYSRTSGSENSNRYEMGNLTNPLWALNLRTATGTGRISLNSAGGTTTSNVGSSDGSGLISGDRPDAANQHIFVNGVDQSIATAVASVALGTEDIFVLCRNNAGVPIQFSVRQISMVFIGASLGATKQLSLYNAFQALMTHYGTQV